MSGSPDVSNSCVFPCRASCVSLSGWWCRALRTSPIHVLPPVEIRLPLLIAIHLSPSLADCVRLFRCFLYLCIFVFHPFVVGPTSLVFHSCLPVWLVVSGALDVRRYSFQNTYLSAALRMPVSTCLRSFASQSGWWCPALRVPVFICLSTYLPSSLGCLSLFLSEFIVVFQCNSLDDSVWMSVFTCLQFI